MSGGPETRSAAPLGRRRRSGRHQRLGANQLTNHATEITVAKNERGEGDKAEADRLPGLMFGHEVSPFVTKRCAPVSTGRSASPAGGRVNALRQPESVGESVGLSMHGARP